MIWASFHLTPAVGSKKPLVATEVQISLTRCGVKTVAGTRGGAVDVFRSPATMCRAIGRIACWGSRTSFNVRLFVPKSGENASLNFVLGAIGQLDPAVVEMVVVLLINRAGPPVVELELDPEMANQDPGDSPLHTLACS